MLSELIKQLQAIYDKEGDMSVIAGHIDEGVIESWGDKIPYEFYHHFTQLSPTVTNIETENFKSETGIKQAVRSVVVPDENENYSLSTDMIESLPHSVQKTLHNQNQQQVLCLHLSGKTLQTKGSH